MGGNAVTNHVNMNFDESDPSWRSPVCVSFTFSMVLPGGSGVTNTAVLDLNASENNQDLTFAGPTEILKAQFGLRVG